MDTRVGSYEYNYVEQYYSNIRFCIFKSMKLDRRDEFLEMAKILCIQIPERVCKYPDFSHLQYAILYAKICNAPEIVELLKKHYKVKLLIQ